MPIVSVSKDALIKVKVALKEYHNDIIGFSARIKQKSAVVSKSVEFEIQKINRQVDDTSNKINQLKIKINQFEETKNAIIYEIKSAEQKFAAAENQTGEKQTDVIRLRDHISQMQQNIKEVQTEKVKCEGELCNEERILSRKLNKQGRMKAAFVKLSDNIDTMLSASNSFETKAISRTEQSVSNIGKCIAAIDAYLA